MSSNNISAGGPVPEKEHSHASEQRNIHELRFLWNLLLSRLWMILSIVAAVMILAGCYILLSQRIYESTAVVQVERRDQGEIKASNNNRDALSQQEELNTIVEKFQSPPLLALVLAQAGILSSNAAENMMPILLRMDFATVPAANGRQPAALPSLNGLQAPAGADDTATKAALKIVMDFRKHVKARLRRNTRLIDISVADPDPQQAAVLANLMVENYLNLDFRIKSTMDRIQNDFFKAEYSRLAEKLEQSEEALQDYRRKYGSVEMADLGTPQTDDEMAQIQQQLTQARSDAIRLKSSYEASLKMGTNVDELLAYNQIASDSQVQILQTAIAQQQAKFVQIKDQYRERNPKYILAQNTLTGLQEQLARTVLEIRHRIQESLRLPYENALSTCKGLQADYEKAQVRKLEVSQKSIRYTVLSRQVAADRAMYDAIYQRVNEISVNSQLAPFNISIIQAAYASTAPSSPRVWFILIVAGLGSLGLGLGLAYVLERVNTTLLTVDDAEEYLLRPVLCAIPRLKFAGKEPEKRLVEIGFTPNSEEVECFRTLRTSLSLSEAKKPLRSLLFVSSFPREGKTFVSCNTAASLAQQGLSTIILDLDLRHPRLEEFFTGVANQIPGLTDVFQQKMKLADVVQRHKDLPKLAWVAAGSYVRDPSELLLHGSLRAVLDEALKQYDRVIIDSSPLHPVKDALLVCGDVDGVIMLVNARKTPRFAANKTVQWLDDMKAPLVGIVLNLQPRRQGAYQYYSHHYYGYGYGYGKDRAEVKGNGG